MTAIVTPRKRAGKSAPKSAEQIAAATVVLQLERSKPSFRVRMGASEIVDKDDGVDKTLLHISKDLLDRKLLSAIGSEDTALRRYLLARAVSCSMLAAGMWLIPLALVNEVDAEVAAYRLRRAALAKELAQVKYADAKQDAKDRLKTHYREDDYPEPDDLEAAFGARARWLSYNVPAALESLNKELYERERVRVEAEWADAGDEIRQALREAFAGLVEHLADKLGTDDEGKPKTFRDSTVDKLNDFLATFAARDLTGDKVLADLARKAQSLLKGADPEDLREKETMRARVLAGMDAIKATLAKLDVVSPRARRLARDGEV